MGRSRSAYQQRKLEAAFARADRDAALRKQDGICKYCFCRLTYKTATRDHVISRAAGGLDHRDNIVAACAPCNRAKGSMPVEQFLRLVTNPVPGGRTDLLLIWVDRRLNAALMQMEKNLFKAMGIRR